MAIVKFYDDDVERKVLAGLFLHPHSWKNVPEVWFYSELSRRTYAALKTFLEPPYVTFPTPDVVIDVVEDPEVKLFVKELSTIAVDSRELTVRQQQLFEMYCTRKMDELIRRLPSSIQNERITEVVKETIQNLAELQDPTSAGLRKREYIYETAQERWERYKELEEDPSKAKGISYHIADLDKYTKGGFRIPHIVMFFAETGGFKTRVKANLAYNFAFLERKDVMVVTLEVPMEDYQHIIDSRHAHLDFNDIISGQLQHNRDRYYSSLNDMVQQKYPLYIVDIPDRSTPADLISELNLYRAKFGKYPDILIIDYLNEMEPMTPWKGTSDKFKNLGVELRWITRSYNVGLIGSMQENREGKKTKNKEKIGLEHIGESHYFSNVCHLVINLFQDEIDVTENLLHWSIKKNRYGPKGVTFATFANPAFNYVGDRQLHIHRGTV